MGQPAHDDLCHRLLVLLGDGPQELVLDNVVPAFGERSPQLDLDPVLLQERPGCDLLVEGMRLDLVDGRNDLVVDEEVHHALGWKVQTPMAFTRPCRYSSSIAPVLEVTSPRDQGAVMLGVAEASMSRGPSWSAWALTAR